MSPNKLMATICYSLLALLMAGVGGQFLHLDKLFSSTNLVAGFTWENLAPSVQQMIICLARTRGMGLLTGGIVMSAILIGPFRLGRQWTRWVLPLLSLTGLVLSIEVVSGLELMPGNIAPLAPFVPAACMALAGCLFSFLDRSFDEMHQVESWPSATPAYERR